MQALKCYIIPINLVGIKTKEIEYEIIYKSEIRIVRNVVSGKKLSKGMLLGNRNSVVGKSDGKVFGANAFNA